VVSPLAAIYLVGPPPPATKSLGFHRYQTRLELPRRVERVLVADRATSREAAARWRIRPRRPCRSSRGGSPRAMASTLNDIRRLGPPGPPGSRRRRRSWPYSWVSVDILLVLAPVDLRHGVPRGLLRRVPFAPAAHDRREQRRHLEHAADGPRWRRRHASGESSATAPLSVSTRSHAA